jgi:flagellar biosynthesis/type III secretory pathway chaperone
MPPLRIIDSSAAASSGDEQQLHTAVKLLEVLETEYRALQSGDAAALTTAAAAKAVLLRAFDPVARARLPEARRDQLDEMLRQARHANLRNGEFINAQQAYVRARWAGLSAIAGHGNFYDAAGITHLPPKPRSALGHA